ncbi:MAG: redoxin family protein [Acidimicrobiales bacterium]
MNEEVRAGARQKHRGYAMAALGLVVLSVIAVVVATRTDPSSLGVGRVDPDNLAVGKPVPSLRNTGEWLNSAPLSSTDLAGKVVVYDFWTYSCVNCVRTLPFLRSWFDRYQADGLVIVGVHTPEFDFEKRRANVEAAVQRLGVTWPVTMDNGRAVWDDFANNWWPAKYVADRDGRLRYQHIGEGAYTETEDVLRALLGVPQTAARAVKPGEEPDLDGRAREQISPETYLGPLRSAGGTHTGVDTYPEPGTLSVDEYRLVGTWDGAGYTATSVSDGAAIVMRYRAGEVNLVLAAASPVDVVVEVDGKPVVAGSRAADVGVEASGATVVRVDRSDMYRLVRSPGVEEHTLRLTVRGTGLSAYAFTFGT